MMQLQNQRSIRVKTYHSYTKSSMFRVNVFDTILTLKKKRKKINIEVNSTPSCVGYHEFSKIIQDC